MKKIKSSVFFSKTFSGYLHKIRVSDLPKNMEPNDIIEINRHESCHNEDDSYDAFTDLVIVREREETDEEYAARKLRTEKFKEELKQRRYENYLELKKEFENTNQ
jgi:hypothetical protein